MWCWYSNVIIPKHATLCYNNKALLPSVSASSIPRQRRQDASTNHQQVGELGQSETLLANIQSNPTPISKQGKQESQPISGSDVLLALQRASARKNVKKKNKKNKQEHGKEKGSSSVEDSAVDYTNVRPLIINAHWAPKLDELGKRLRELSDTI